MIGHGEGYVRAIASGPTDARVAVGTWEGEIQQYDIQWDDDEAQP